MCAPLPRPAVADAMRKEMGAEVGVLNSGVLRAEVMYASGTIITVKDVLDILPIEDIVLSIQLKGCDLKEALESGFSRYPAHEGRFPLISGMNVLVSAAGTPGQRLLEVLPLPPSVSVRVYMTGFEGQLALKSWKGQ